MKYIGKIWECTKHKQGAQYQKEIQYWDRMKHTDKPKRNPQHWDCMKHTDKCATQKEQSFNTEVYQKKHTGKDKLCTDFTKPRALMINFILTLLQHQQQLLQQSQAFEDSSSSSRDGFNNVLSNGSNDGSSNALIK
ncbi:hypothetical protein F8M41_012410 [Gigaspora margarita]|uniref:Uncharacterized protein n=1 Tax=Gigaspora margarita TaxID=4874 RepID=A0A8H3ZZZ0_GIGMA|nr:hypothetical protein F8M41_012410 [Gigaspora margarita]